MSEEIKCVRCLQPDIPFITYYIFEDRSCYVIRTDPFDIEVRKTSHTEGNKEIKQFDAAMHGANNGKNRNAPKTQNRTDHRE